MRDNKRARLDAIETWASDTLVCDSEIVGDEAAELVAFAQRTVGKPAPAPDRTSDLIAAGCGYL